MIVTQTNNNEKSLCMIIQRLCTSTIRSVSKNIFRIWRKTVWHQNKYVHEYSMSYLFHRIITIVSLETTGTVESNGETKKLGESF